MDTPKQEPKQEKKSVMLEMVSGTIIALFAFFFYYKGMNSMVEVNNTISNRYQEIINNLSDTMERQRCNCLTGDEPWRSERE